MRKHAIQTLTGGYKTVEKDVEYTHWILDREMYEGMFNKCNRCDELEKKYQDILHQNTELKEAYQEKSQKLDNLTAYLNEKKDQIDNAVREREKLARVTAQAKKDIEDVIRITKERANKERKIKYKKSNPGYRVLSSEWYVERYGSKRQRQCYVWKTVIETPFYADYNYHQFNKLWKSDKDRIQLFDELNIGEYREADLDKSDFDEKIQEAFYYRTIEKRIPEKYWIVTIYHTQEVCLS